MCVSHAGEISSELYSVSEQDRISKDDPLQPGALKVPGFLQFQLIIVHISRVRFLLVVGVTLYCAPYFPQSILKKAVTVQQTPSAERENKVDTLFQAAKRDLLQVIQIKVKPETSLSAQHYSI